MMRLIAGLWLACCALVLGGCFAEPAPPQPPASPPLFAIADDEGNVRGWLLGTIHALPDDTQWSTPQIERALDKADRLIVEVSDPGGPDAGAAFAALARTDGLAPLRERIDPDLDDELQLATGRIGAASRDWSSTETWAAALMLAQSQSTGKRENGVDLALIEQFDANAIDELEGARGQLEIFDTLAPAQQRDLLESVLRDVDTAPARGARLREAWRRGDMEALDAATRTGFLARPDLREVLLARRNRAWIDPIVERLESDARPFVAVGAAHLVGADGLIALLAKRGFTAESLH